MPDYHSRLGPSAAERWLACPASVGMSERVVVPQGGENIYAAEGTRAHKIAGTEAALAFGLIDEKEYKEQYKSWENESLPEEREDMLKYAALYVELLRDLLAERPHSKIMLEQRVDTGVPGSWGTADAIIVSTTHIRVVDYKYGTGVAVDATENPQIKLYSLGALDEYGDVLGETEIVSMTIFQPRLGSTSHYHQTPEQLRRWRKDYVIPTAAEALGEHPRFNPGEVQCRWCPAKGECKPRMMKFARMDFGDPDLLTPEEISEALDLVAEIRDWCAAVDDLALDKIYSQRIPIPGWKVVRSSGRRGIPDAAAAIQTLIDNGYEAEQVSNISTKPLGELEKLVGKKELPEILGDLLVKGQGKPSLAREDDKRASITPNSEALKVFDVVSEEE